MPVYSHEVLRKAKKQKIELEALGLSEKKALKEYTLSLAAFLEPATVFGYFEPNHSHANLLMPPNAVAYTCGILTLGDKLESKINDISDENEIRLIEIACDVFMNTGINFVKDLIAKEAALESFELGEIEHFYQKTLENFKENDSKLEVLNTLLTELQAEKIGVKITETNQVAPRFTSAFTIGWFPKNKKKSQKPAKSFSKK